MTDQNPVDRINDLRQKVIDGESITKEEAAEAVQLLRASRTAALGSQKQSSVPMNLGDLFGGAQKTS